MSAKSFEDIMSRNIRAWLSAPFARAKDAITICPFFFASMARPSIFRPLGQITLTSTDLRECNDTDARGLVLKTPDIGSARAAKRRHGLIERINPRCRYANMLRRHVRYRSFDTRCPLRFQPAVVASAFFHRLPRLCLSLLAAAHAPVMRAMPNARQRRAASRQQGVIRQCCYVVLSRHESRGKAFRFGGIERMTAVEREYVGELWVHNSARRQADVIWKGYRRERHVARNQQDDPCPPECHASPGDERWQKGWNRRGAPAAREGRYGERHCVNRCFFRHSMLRHQQVKVLTAR